MSEGIAIALIGASVPFICALGAGFVWLVKFIQAQSKATIDAKDAEINALKARLSLIEEQKEGRT